MASLLRQGREMKGQALAGLGQVADVESRQNIAEEQLKMAKEAQEQQLYGTAMGLGAIASMGTASKAGTLGAKAVTASGATAGTATASAVAAVPYVALALAGAFILNKLFD